eukprot:TRINITY_DN7394_c0_g2_i4.p1 TRINITY_DN7394_c0_g2~~TRINITY_DN7394_c0_g2_i4.p1  ORF type:complete len:853 (+),score=309.08 TRINITY_DN7394_c0_g2_i4:25-2559(+)
MCIRDSVYTVKPKSQRVPKNMNIEPKIFIAVNDFNNGETFVDTSDITFYVTYNGKCVGVQNVGETSNKVLVALNPKVNSEVIQLLFRRNSLNEVLGSVSISSDSFASLNKKSYTQWLTLFDDPEDDIFDGDIGKDDEEVPKALVTFNLEGFPYAQPVAKKTTPVPNSGNTSTISNSNKNVSNTNTPAFDRDAARRPSNKSSTSQLKEEDKSPQRSMENSGKGQNVVYQKLGDAEEFSLLISRIDLLVDLLKQVVARSPEDAIKSINLVENVKDTFISEYMKKYYETTKGGPKNMRDFELEIAKLKLEIEKAAHVTQKSIDIKVNLTKTEVQLNEVTKKYNESLREMENQSKVVLDENQKLRTQINDLDNQVRNDQIVLDESKKDYELRMRQQAEIDALKLEKAKQKNKNLNTVIVDRDQQIQLLNDNAKNEQDQRAKLLQAYDELEEKYKRSLEDLAQARSLMAEREKQAEADIQEVNKALSITKQNEVNLDAKNKELTRDLNSAREQIRRLEQDLRTANEDLKQLRDELQEERSSKISEIASLTETVNQLHNKLHELEVDNANLIKDLDLLHQERDRNQNVNFYDQFVNMEAKLAESENARHQLQLELENAERNWQEKLDYYNQPDYQAIQREIDDLKKQRDNLVHEIRDKNEKIIELNRTISELRIQITIFTQHKHIQEALEEQLRAIKQSQANVEAERDKLQNDLYRVTDELIQQTNVSLEQHNIINSLADEVNRLEKDLEIAMVTLPKEDYSPNKGDEVDQQLGDYLNQNHVPVKFIRIGEGQYKFGTRRIFVKILRGRLVIRVGGGYLLIEEFLRLYTCLLYTSPSPRDGLLSRMPSSA